MPDIFRGFVSPMNALLKSFAVLLVLGTSSVLVHATPEPPDPILGRWAWFNNRLVSFKDDGTCESTKGDKGTWVFLNNAEVQRKYRLTWGHGLSIDKFILAEDKQSGKVVTDKNELFRCRRATDSVDPSPTTATTAADSRKQTASTAGATAAGEPKPDFLGRWTLHITRANGEKVQYVMDFRADGTWSFDREFHGTWSVEDNHLCVYFKNPSKWNDRYSLPVSDGELRGNSRWGDKLVLDRKAASQAGVSPSPGYFGTRN